MDNIDKVTKYDMFKRILCTPVLTGYADGTFTSVRSNCRNCNTIDRLADNGYGLMCRDCYGNVNITTRAIYFGS